jgi:hypothetical protein
LLHGNSKKIPVVKDLHIPESTKRGVDKIDINQTLNQLYVPESPNYVAINAWIPGIGAFQMTVGKSHSFNIKAKEDLAKIREGNKLYWLLPPLYYNSFTKKNPRTIEQFAVQIPFSI